MATFLDTGFLANFRVIFTFILVYVIIFGIAEMSKPFGKDKRNINALLALAIAVLVVISPPIVALVEFLLPWFFIMALVLFFILFGLRVFGGDTDFSGAVKDKRVYTWIIVIVVVIMIFGLGRSFGSQTLEKGEWDGTGAPPSDAELGDDEDVDSGEDDPTGLKNTGVDGTSVATDDFGTNLIHTIFNPKVLGLILVMLVGVFAMFFLSD